MAREYAVITYVKRNGSLCTALIDHDELKESPIEDFFEPGCTDITEAGRIQVMGDTDILGDHYTEHVF